MLEKEIMDNELLSVFAFDESKKLKFCSRCNLVYLLREDLGTDFLTVCPVCGESLHNNGSCSHQPTQPVNKRKYRRNLLW